MYPGQLLIPWARQPALLGATDHVLVFLMPPFFSRHLVRDLDSVAIWVADVDTDSMAVVRHLLDGNIPIFDPVIKVP